MQHTLLIAVTIRVEDGRAELEQTDLDGLMARIDATLDTVYPAVSQAAREFGAKVVSLESSHWE